jgi:hypothetical protein
MSIQFIYCATHLNIVLTTYVMSTSARIHGLDEFNQRKGYFDVC